MPLVVTYLKVLGQCGSNKNNGHGSYKKGGVGLYLQTAPPYLLEEHRYENILIFRTFLASRETYPNSYIEYMILTTTTAAAVTKKLG